MKALFIGDIFGKQGRKALATVLPKLAKEEKIDLVIANGENCTHGRSLNKKHYQQLLSLGVNYITFGNHTWDHLEMVELLKDSKSIVRPYNLNSNFKYANIGNGYLEIFSNGKKIILVNLLGASCFFNQNQTNPFIAMEEILNKTDADLYFVDFHAETTSEKNAFLLAFANRVHVIVGTHTHVQTADEKIYQNTAYITDLGMTGPSLGVIGAEPGTIIDMFYNRRERFILTPSKSPWQFGALLVEIDSKNKVKQIKRFLILES